MRIWRKTTAIWIAVGGLLLGVSGAWAQGSSPPVDPAKAAIIDDVSRLLQEADAEAAAGAKMDPAYHFLLPIPPRRIADEDYGRFLRTGEQPQGVAVRDDISMPSELDPYFEGTFKRSYHVYLDQDVATYDKGVYAVPRQAAYVGNFEYFPVDSAFVTPKGSFVLVGKKLRPDGSAETGIFIAEDASARFSLNFVRATPAYLEDFRRRHARAVDSYRRRMAAEEESGFSFGQVLALGLGAAMIGVSDLPSADKLQLGSAFVSDVMNDSGGTAMRSMMSGAAGANGGGLFSGGMNFSAPGLNAMMQGNKAVAGAGTLPPVRSQTGQAAPVSAPAAQVGLRFDNYSFTCPMGGSHTIKVPYKTQACGTAAKNFARTYACNLIDDFTKVQRQCQQACGHPQCAE